MVNLGILAQKSEFYLQLEEALKSSNCKFSYEMTAYLMVVLNLRVYGLQTNHLANKEFYIDIKT